jgi:hypothetical protein
MPLKVTDLSNAGQIAALNRWADEVENRLPTIPGKQSLTTVLGNLTRRIAILEKQGGDDE